MVVKVGMVRRNKILCWIAICALFIIEILNTYAWGLLVEAGPSRIIGVGLSLWFLASTIVLVFMIALGFTYLSNLSRLERDAEWMRLYEPYYKPMRMLKTGENKRGH